MTCQITFLPFNVTDAEREVQRIIDLLSSYDITYEIHDLSTTIRGEPDVIFWLIRDIYEQAAKYVDIFRLHVELLHKKDS